MNYIILYATSIITKTRVKKIRILIGSILGAMYAVIVVLDVVNTYSTPIFKILFSVVMVYVSLQSKTLKKLLKDLLMFYLTSFTFGGIALALLYFIKPEQVLMKNGVYLGSYPLKIALIAAILGYVIVTTAFKIKKRMSKKDILCDIKITENEKSISVKALIDTGNFLKDPITSEPVIVVEAEVLEQIYPKEIIDNVDNIVNGNFLNINNEEYMSRLRVIPFNSLGKENGMLLGLRKDYVEVFFNEEFNRVDNIIIGIYSKKISKTGVYQALLNLEILNNKILV